MPPAPNLTGRRYGRLVVLDRAPNYESGCLARRSHVAWRCKCDCGAEVVVRTYGLTSGLTQSCKCRQRDTVRRRNTTHGYASRKDQPPEYGVWALMKSRCLNQKNKSFAYYGGRGITVCDRWLDFEPFYADMGPRPSPEHSIERVDNSLGYEPDNCVWATDFEQMNNTRRNVYLEAFGKRQSVAQWARELGMSDRVLHARLVRHNWTVEKALTVPVASPSRKRLPYLEAFGRRQSLLAWCREYGLGIATLSWRIRKGWDAEKALTTPPIHPSSRKRVQHDTSQHHDPV